MSVPSTSPTNDREKRRFKSSIVWISLSFLLSAVLLVWAFTSPFRQSGEPLVSSMTSGPAGEYLELSDRIRQRRANAEAFREEAIAMDQEFMRSLAKSRVRKPVPGIKEVKVRWNRHVETVKMQLRQLRNSEKGSPEWLYQQELLESLKDAPQ